MRTEFYAILLLLVSLCAGCRAKREPHQPLSLRTTDPAGATSAELFTSSDIIGARPTISSSQAFEIWLQLSPAAADRWTQLPEGTQLLCSSPRGTIGRTAVEHTMGIGKGGYYFRLTYNTQQEFVDAVRKLR